MVRPIIRPQEGNEHDTDTRDDIRHPVVLGRPSQDLYVSDRSLDAVFKAPHYGETDGFDFNLSAAVRPLGDDRRRATSY
jgi:hypothetical protein